MKILGLGVPNLLMMRSGLLCIAAALLEELLGHIADGKVDIERVMQAIAEEG